MKFPGTNSMTLSEDAIKSALLSQIAAIQGADVRITSIDIRTYPTRITVRITVEFTTDPERAQLVPMTGSAEAA